MSDMYKCEGCGLEVAEIPRFREGECPDDVQHYFRKREDPEDKQSVGRASERCEL